MTGRRPSSFTSRSYALRPTATTFSTSAADARFSVSARSGAAPARSAARRRRDAEAALAKGDVAAFAQLQGTQGVVVADVAPRVETRSADELLAASERRAPEVSIAAAFYNTQTGQTTTTTRATKTQKRKHQINSLAIAAAERELELMEKRGRATKTKAETNAKYGW